MHWRHTTKPLELTVGDLLGLGGEARGAQPLLELPHLPVLLERDARAALLPRLRQIVPHIDTLGAAASGVDALLGKLATVGRFFAALGDRPPEAPPPDAAAVDDALAATEARVAALEERLAAHRREAAWRAQRGYDAAERVAAIECGMLDVEEAMEVVDHGHAALRTDVAALEVMVGREAIKRGKARRLINGSTSKELLAATPSRGTPTSMTGRVESFLGKMAI